MHVSLVPRPGVRQAWMLKSDKPQCKKIDKPELERVLVVTSSAWNDIQDHIHREERQREHARQELAYRQHLKDASKEMTKNWENSEENVRKRRLEARAKFLEEQNASRVARFYELRDEQIAERKAFTESIRKKQYRTEHDASKTLNSAYVLSETLYEREVQKELEREIKRQGDEDERIYGESILKAAEEEEMEKQKKREAVKEKKKKYHELIVNELTSLENSRKEDHDKQIKDEIEDLKNMAEEIKIVKEKEKQQIEEKKQKVRKVVEDDLVQRMKYRKQIKQELEEEEKYIKKVAEERQKAIDLQKAEEKERRDEKMRILEKLSHNLQTESDSIKEKEEAILKKAQAELLAIEEKKLAEENAYQKMLRENRIQNRKEYLEKKKVRKETETEKEKWEILNRYKVDEINKKILEDAQIKDIEKKRKTKKILIEQIKDKKITAKEEKEKRQLFYNNAFKNIQEDDEKFLNYAEEVVTDAKNNGRPIYPIQKAILEFKRTNNLLPLSKNNPNLKSNINFQKKINPKDDPTYGRCKCQKQYLYK